MVVTSVPVAWELGVVEFGRAKLEVLAAGELFNPISANAVFRPETWEGPGLVMGWLIFVERYMISLPCTTRLSFDFFKSNVSISGRPLKYTS